MNISTIDREKYLDEQKIKLLKAIRHLLYSYQKILILPALMDTSDEASLEVWESFAARFARVTDLFLMKYLRARLLIEDPGFSGSLRDALYFGEKLGILEEPEVWLAIRELRNIAAHEYAEDDLPALYHKLKTEAARLIKLKDMI